MFRMNAESPVLVLERRAARYLSGCMLFLAFVTFLIFFMFHPEAAVAFGIFLSVPIVALLFTMWYDFSGKRNIVITPTGILFGAGIYRYRSIKIEWEKLDLAFPTTLSSGQEMPDTGTLNLREKSADDSGKQYRIKFSHLGGRQVEGHMGFYDKGRAIGLIRNLRDAASPEERAEMIEAAKGMPVTRYKMIAGQIPFASRLVLPCPACAVNLVYDKKKEISEQPCPSCGGEIELP